MAVDFTQKQIDEYHTRFLTMATIHPENINIYAHEYLDDDRARLVDYYGKTLLEQMFENRLFALLDRINDLSSPLLNPLLLKRDEKGNSLLHIAVIKNDKEEIRILLNIFRNKIFFLENSDGKLASKLVDVEKNPDVREMFIDAWIGRI